MKPKFKYGIRRLVLLNTESYSLGDFPLDRPLSISATNNVGKSTAINALQFPFLCNRRDMVFPKEDKETLKYYFPYENSYILSEILTDNGTYVVGAAGKGQLSGYEYQLFAIKKELNLSDFLIENETMGNKKKIRNLQDLERHLSLKDIWLKRLRPKQMQDALIGKEITIKGEEKFSIGVFRLKSMTDKNYHLFMSVFKNLLHMNNFNMEEIKMFLINSLLPSWEGVSYDFMNEYSAFNQSLEKERKKIETAKSIKKDVCSLVKLKTEWDNLFNFLSPAFNTIETRYEKTLAQKKEELEKIKSGYSRIEHQMHEIKSDNDIRQKEYGQFFNRHEELKKWLNDLEHKDSRYKLFPPVETFKKKIIAMEDKRDQMVLELGKSKIDSVERIKQKIDRVRNDIAGFESHLENIKSNLLFVLKRYFNLSEIQILMKLINQDIFKSFSINSEDLCVHNEKALVRQLQILLLRCEKEIYTDGTITINLGKIHPVDVDDYFNHDRIKKNLELSQKDERELQQRLTIARNYQQKETEKKVLEQKIREQTNELGQYKSFLKDKESKPIKEKEFLKAKDSLKSVAFKKNKNDALIADLNKRITGDFFEIKEKEASLVQMETERQKVLVVKDFEGNTGFDRNDFHEMADVGIDTLIREYVAKRGKLINIKDEIYQCFSNIELRGGNRFSSGKDIPTRIKEFEESTRDENIESYENVLQRNETAATRQLGAMLKSLSDQFDEFGIQIKNFNRQMNKYQISNIRKIEFIVDENNQILNIIKTLINEDSIFGGDKDIYRVVARFSELIDKKGVKISLPNIFNLGILVQLENGKEIKSFGNTSIQSTGTDLTVKVVINVMLLSRLLNVKQNQMLNIPAYIDEAGQIDSINQQTLIDQCEKAGFVPIFASVEAQSTAEYWIGLKEVDGKIYVDQDDWYRLTAKPFEEKVY